MAIIGLGKIGYNLIPILIGCIFCFLSRLLYLYKDTKLFSHAILTNLILLVAQLFMIIPHLMIKRQIISYHNESEFNLTDDKSQLIYNDNNDVSVLMKGKYPFIILSSFLASSQGIIVLFVKDIISNTWILDILFTLIFYYLLFKIKLYKHHYLSIILIILSGIILDLILGNLQSDANKSLLLFLLSLFREIIFSLNIVINKYLFEKKFCSTYEIIFFNGVFGLIYFGIFAIFDYYFFKFDNFEEYFSNFNIIELLVIFGMIITQLGLNLSNLFTNKKNSPCHVFIIYVFGKFAYYIILSINSLIIIIFLIFILFLSLIFNEIIEINCFGLSKYTKKNIIKRAENEEKDEPENDNDSFIGIPLVNIDNPMGNEEE